MLTNPVYKGKYYGLRYKSTAPKSRRTNSYGKTSHGQRDREHWIHLPEITVVNPIVTEAEFEYVQQRLVTNRENASRNTRHEYLLRSLVFCGVCGRRYYAHRDGARGCYLCGGRRSRTVGSFKCDNRYVRAEELEGAVWELIREFLENPDIVLQETEREAQSTCTTIEVLASNLLLRRRELDKSYANEQAALDYYQRVGASEEEVRRKLAHFKARCQCLSEDIGRIESDLALARQQKASVEAVSAIREQVGARLAGASLDDRRWVMEQLDTKVHIWPDRAEVQIAAGTPISGAGFAYKKPRFPAGEFESLP